MAVSERTVTGPPSFITVSHLLPAELDQATARRIRHQVELVCAAIGLRQGPVNLDLVVDHRDEAYLVELGARLGGNGLGRLIARTLGVNLVEPAIRLAVGEQVRLRRTRRPRHRAGIVYALHAPHRGTLASVDGARAVGASLSLVFVTLGATRFHGESGLLLLVISLWSLLFNGFAYLLRVFQPQLTVALSRAGGVQGRQQALRLARLAAAGVAGWLGLLGAAALLGGGLPALLRGLPLPLAAALVLLPRLPILALAGGATWLLENADPGSLRLAATAAAGGLAGVAVLSVMLVPWLGAPGAVLALSGFEVVQVAVLLGGLSAGRRPGAGQPPGSRSAA